MTRTVTTILAERRSVIQEQRHERDATARAILQFQIDELSRELNALTKSWLAPSPAVRP